MSFDLPNTYANAAVKIFNIMNPSSIIFQQDICYHENMTNTESGQNPCNQESFSESIDLEESSGIFIAVLFVDGVKRGGTVILKNN